MNQITGAIGEEKFSPETTVIIFIGFLQLFGLCMYAKCGEGPRFN